MSHARASQCEDHLEAYGRIPDGHGLLWTFLHTATNQPPLRRDDYTGGNWEYRDCWQRVGVPAVPERWLPYEDSLGVTGYFLAALLRRLAVAPGPDTRQRIRHAFDGINWVHELGQQIERGFLPKPYSLAVSRQWSTDNQCAVFLALSLYSQSILDDRSRAVAILQAAADYYLKHHHCPPFPYFTFGPVDYESDQIYPGFWPLLFLPLYWDVYQRTGDARYRAAYEWLLTERLQIDQPLDAYAAIGAKHRWAMQLLHLRLIQAPPADLWQRAAGRMVAAFNLPAERLPVGPHPDLNVLSGAVALGQGPAFERALTALDAIALDDGIYVPRHDPRWRRDFAWWSEHYYLYSLTQRLFCYWEAQARVAGMQSLEA